MGAARILKVGSWFYKDEQPEKLLMNLRLQSFSPFYLSMWQYSRYKET
jgi:hypothetical protein